MAYYLIKEQELKLFEIQGITMDLGSEISQKFKVGGAYNLQYLFLIWSEETKIDIFYMQAIFSAKKAYMVEPSPYATSGATR